MKSNNSYKDDKSLHELLQQWKLEATLPPRFQEQVWQRIELAEEQKPQSGLAAFSHWVDIAFRRPAFACVYMAALLFVGLGAGYWQAQDRMAQSQSEWRARYVQSVDPYQAPRN